jgi:CBS domain-containing protein
MEDVMKVNEIMTEDVATASPDSTLEDIAIIMRDEDTGAVPIVEDGELVGLITDRDIVMRCIAAGREAAETTADDILSNDLETVEPGADVGEASRLMSRKQIRRLPVVENGRLMGMVSLGDIAVKAGEQDASGALEDVSRGVKASRATRQQRGKQPSGAKNDSGRKAGVSASRRLDQERGASRLVSGGRNSKQGIANRSAAEEQGRQRKVVPIRNEGKTTRKRRAS